MSLELKTGTVVTASPFTITVGASTVAVPAIRPSGYTPAIGDVVGVLDDGSMRWVLGKVVTT